jgi:hypothetical protein
MVDGARLLGIVHSHRAKRPKGLPAASALQALMAIPAKSARNRAENICQAVDSVSALQFSGRLSGVGAHKRALQMAE